MKEIFRREEDRIVVDSLKKKKGAQLFIQRQQTINKA